MKFPASAKQVYKGLIFDVYQWRQKMFDGSYKIFEGVKKQDTVVIFPVQDEKIILIKQKQPGTGWYYGVPSGRMDKPGETPQKAALRELLEETGLKPKSIFLWKKTNDNNKIDHNIYVYVARGCRKVADQSPDNGEKIRVLPVSFKEFLAFSDRSDYFAGPTLIDILKARINGKYRKNLQKMFFGKMSSPQKKAGLASQTIF